MKVHRTMFRCRSCETRNTTWWRAAKFGEICADAYLTWARVENLVPFKDHLFGFEEARKTIERLWKS